MFEKILVPLDGSQLAEVALPYAEELAGRLGSEIILLSVSESEEAQEYHKHQIYLSKIIETTRHSAEKYRDKAADKMIKAELEVLVGHPADEILSYAEKEEIGLIIMATHGHSGIRRWTLGSVADKVVRGAKPPVVLTRARGFPPGLREKGILNKALVPLDGSQESEAIIPYIMELTSRLKMEVTLLQVVSDYDASTDAENYLKEKMSLFESKDIPVKYEIRVGAGAEQIIKLEEESSIDLVAMSTRERSSIRRRVLGTVVDRVLSGGKAPVLLVRAVETVTE